MFLFASYSNYVLKFMISAQTHEKPSSLECGQRSVNNLRFILYPREWEFIAQVHKNVTFSPKSNLNIFQFHFVYTSHITNLKCWNVREVLIAQIRTPNLLARNAFLRNASQTYLRLFIYLR